MAPAILIYKQLLETGDWSWALAFIYVAAVAVRLARFNIEQGGRAHLHFHGMPSPMAGVTLASFYPFSQTAPFEALFSSWPWTRLIGGGMIVLAGLMLSLSHTQAADKPNIVVIMGDDVGWSNISSYGGDILGVSTPNIDRLRPVLDDFFRNLQNSPEPGPLDGVLPVKQLT